MSSALYELELVAGAGDTVTAVAVLTPKLSAMLAAMQAQAATGMMASSNIDDALVPASLRNGGITRANGSAMGGPVTGCLFSRS